MKNDNISSKTVFGLCIMACLVRSVRIRVNIGVVVKLIFRFAKSRLRVIIFRNIMHL